MKRKILPAALFALLSVSCIAETDGTLAEKSSSLSIDDATDAVVAIHSADGPVVADTAFCSATLIGTSSAVTSAACVVGLSATDLVLYAGQELAADSDPFFVDVAAIEIHEDYDARSGEADVARLWFSDPVDPAAHSNVPVLPPELHVIADDVEPSVRVVGFKAGGKSVYDTDVKRDSSITISYTPAHSKQCPNGGEAVLVEHEGTTYLAGFATSWDATCSRSVENTRVDVYAEFLR